LTVTRQSVGISYGAALLASSALCGKFEIAVQFLGGVWVTGAKTLRMGPVLPQVAGLLHPGEGL
jgi:hypothetical protein